MSKALIDRRFAKRWQTRMLRIQSDLNAGRAPALQSFELDWSRVNRRPGKRGYNPFEGPLLAVLTSVEQGEYPPPEYLIALNEAFTEYLNGHGELEECLLGRRTRGVGGYAAKHKAFSERCRRAEAFFRLVSEGKSKTDAALEVVPDDNPDTTIKAIHRATSVDAEDVE